MRALCNNTCMQPTPAVILFSAKSYKIIKDAIMADQVPCFQFCFYFLNEKNSDHFDESSGEVAITMCWLFYEKNEITCSSCVI